MSPWSVWSPPPPPPEGIKLWMQQEPTTFEMWLMGNKSLFSRGSPTLLHSFSFACCPVHFQLNAEFDTKSISVCIIAAYWQYAICLC